MEEVKTIYTQKEASEIIENFITNTASIKKTRESNFIKYERFVLDGEQWEETEKPEGKKPCLTFNHSEDFISTYKSKLFPRSSQTGTLNIGVKILDTDKKEEKEKEILECYAKNKLAQIILEQSQNFLVGGSGCLYYPKDIATGSAKIISIDPTTVYLGWNGQNLEQFGFEDEISLAEANKSTNTNWISNIIKKIFDKDDASKKFKKAKRITYWDKDCQIIKVEDTFKITKNEHGFIPFSWIPNEPKAHRHEGVSEAKKLFTLEKEYNARSSDFAQRVKTNTKPVLATFSEDDFTKLDGEKIEGILPMGQSDKAEFLTLTENKELLDYLKLLADKMNTKMAVNDAVNGEVKSNVSSLSMIYYFSPLMDRIGMKRIYWDEAFRELNQAILKYKFGNAEYKTEPIYEPVLLTDVKTKIENTVLLLENKLISHEEAIDELRGSENAEQKIKEILEEEKKFDANLPKPEIPKKEETLKFE